MSSKIGLIFLICLIINVNSDQYLSQIGSYLTREGPIIFKETSVTVYLTRHYTNACVNSKFEDIKAATKCNSNYENKKASEVFDAIVAECDKIWNSQIENLKNTLPHSRIKRQNNTNDEKINTRNRRELASVMAGVSLFVNLITTLTGIVSGMYHFFREKELTNAHRSLYLKNKKSNLIAATIAKDNTHNINLLNEVICNSNILNSLELKELHTNFILRDNIRDIEQELLSLSYGDLPRSVSFISSILELCTKIGKNTRQFCKRLIYTNTIELNFEGTTVRNGVLVGMLTLEIPVQSNNFDNNYSFKITNMGNFGNNTFFLVPLPDYALIASNGNTYSLDKTKCNRDLCDINALKLNNKARCFNSLLKYKTSFCLSINSEPPGCVFHRVKLGTIITATNAIFFPVSANSVSAISINRQTILVKTAGRLLCKGDNFNSTHILEEPHIFIKGNSSLKLTERVIIKNAFNLSMVDHIDSKQIALEKELLAIYETDDTLSVGEREYRTIWVIVIISLLITLFTTAIYLIIRFRKTLTNVYRTYFEKVRSIRGNHKTNQMNNKDSAIIETETKFNGENQILLINKEQNVLYPNID